MRSAQDIQAEIHACFGFFPPFFAPALATPMVLQNLWQQTQLAYLQNPLPALFKEKVAALLARYCSVPYCLICHSSALGGLGLEAKVILSLLEQEMSSPEELAQRLRALPTQSAGIWPEPNSYEEKTLLDCCHVMYAQDSVLAYHEPLRAYLGVANYNNLVAFIAYNRTALSWAEANPELPWGDDQRVRTHLGALVASEPRLALHLAGAAAGVQAARRGDDGQNAVPKNASLAPGPETLPQETSYAIAQQTLFLQAILDCTAQGIWGLDLFGNMTFVNRRALEMFGYEPGTNLIGQSPHDLFHHSYANGEPYPKELCPIFKATRSGADVLLETEIFWRADGSTFCGEYRSKPIFVHGTLAGAVVSVLDVTTKVRAGHEAVTQRQELAWVLESMNDAYFSVDGRGRISSVNGHHASKSGLPREAQIGQDFRILLRKISNSRADAFCTALAQAMAGSEHVLLQDYDPDQAAWRDVNIYPKPDGGAAIFLSDISARKKAEEALARSATQLQRIFANSPVAMALWTGPNLTLELINPFFAENFYDDTWLGRAFAPLLKDAQHGHWVKDLGHVLEHGDLRRSTCVRRSRDADSVAEPRHFDCIFVPLTDASGRPYGVYAHALDVTLRVSSKVALEKQALALADAVAHLHQERDFRDSFVASLTHDLRTPIASAKMATQLLQRRHRDDVAAQKSTARIVGNLDRANRMIENLLDASRIKAGDGVALQISAANMDDIVAGVVADAALQHGERFIFGRAKDAIWGHWDAFAVQRVLENLLTNAVKYGDVSAPITVALAHDDVWVDLSVHNSGAPIPAADQPSLFDAYRRTQSAQRGKQKGWGLGLALVKGIALAHGGEVGLHSQPGSGTTFHVRLPIDSRPRQ